MSFERLKRVSRSLAAQTAALILLFLIFALGYYVLLPLNQMQELDPVLQTRGQAEIEISVANSLSDLEQSEALREIASANEHFRYFARRGDQSVQFGGPPRWVGNIDFSMISLGGDAAMQVNDCTSEFQWSTTFSEPDAPARVSYVACGGVETIYEIGGISAPIDSITNVFSSRNLMALWKRSGTLLKSTFAFLVIGALVSLSALRSMHRITRVAAEFDASRGARLLPEDGIPTEVVPLIHAVNEMIRRLQEAQQQQGFFLSTAAHEMRTPMTILRTRLEELPESVTKDELRADCESITALVDQLLRLMHVRNRSELTDQVNIVDVTQAVIAERAPLSISRGVEIELDSEVDSLIVDGDEGLIGVAISNLVDNAISFSKRGDLIKVQVSKSGELSVVDEGPGVPDAVLGSIFEPFAKNPPARDGFGLGLAIVKSIIRLHRGDVSVANNADGGATFTLHFK